MIQSPKYDTHAVYISYARNDKKHPGWKNIEQLAIELQREIARGNITCYIDKKHLGVGDPITEFEEAIGKGECVILVFSEKYFQSPHCMYEYMQIKEGRGNGQIKHFYAINADGCDIKSHRFRDVYVKFWGGEMASYEKKINSQRDILDKARQYGFYIDEIDDIPKYLSKDVYATADGKDELLKKVYGCFGKTYDPETWITRTCKFIKHNIVAVILWILLIVVLFFPESIGLPTITQDTSKTDTPKNNGKQDTPPQETSYPDYIDLGLPSGVLWATCNLGAQYPWEYGSYFAWGETKSKTDYSQSTYQHAHAILGKYDDAATACLGSKWRMPTSKEYDELKAQCDWEWTGNYGGQGGAGYIVRSRKHTDRAIFVPAAGCMRGTKRAGVGAEGYYWTSTICENAQGFAWFLFCNDGHVSLNNDYRCYGFPIRPVRQ